jgi:hypothetical protein
MTFEKIPDVTRQRELLGFQPKIDIEDGVRRVANRIIGDYENGYLRNRFSASDNKSNQSTVGGNPVFVP